MTSCAALFALPSAWHTSQPPIFAIRLQSSLCIDQWPRWHSCEQYQTRHLEHLEEPSLPQAAQTVGATATSFSEAAGAPLLAGVHLFALVRVAPLASTRACCWAPLPMAPLPMAKLKIGAAPQFSRQRSVFATTRRQRGRGGPQCLLRRLRQRCNCGAANAGLARSPTRCDSLSASDCDLASRATLDGQSRGFEESVERWEEFKRGRVAYASGL